MKKKRIIVSMICFLSVFVLSAFIGTNKECIGKENIEADDIKLIGIDDMADNVEQNQTNTITFDIQSLIANISKEDLEQKYQDIINDIVDDILKENQYKWDIEKLNYIKYDNAPTNTRKSYMSYKAITRKTSPQYKLQQIAYTGTYGIRQVNGRFCIALGSAYTTTVGNYVDIILENGQVIECILADLKQDIHTDETNRVAFDGSLVEFVVDTDYIINKVRISGDVSVVCEEWKSMVAEVIVYDKVEDF